MDNNPQHANRRALRSAGQLPVDPEAQLNTQLAGQDTLGKGEITRAEPQNKKQNLKKKKGEDVNACVGPRLTQTLDPDSSRASQCCKLVDYSVSSPLLCLVCHQPRPFQKSTSMIVIHLPSYIPFFSFIMTDFLPLGTSLVTSLSQRHKTKLLSRARQMRSKLYVS